jgi:type I restriction enzyme R subunit
MIGRSLMLAWRTAIRPCSSNSQFSLPEEDEDRGKAALTQLLNDVKTPDTPIIVERVVTDIDEIVRLVRFPGWQGTQAGEREVKKALRKALFKYKLHADEELFEKAYSYIRQYY